MKLLALEINAHAHPLPSREHMNSRHSKQAAQGPDPTLLWSTCWEHPTGTPQPSIVS